MLLQTAKKTIIPRFGGPLKLAALGGRPSRPVLRPALREVGPLQALQVTIGLYFTCIFIFLEHSQTAPVNLLAGLMTQSTQLDVTNCLLAVGSFALQNHANGSKSQETRICEPRDGKFQPNI